MSDKIKLEKKIEQLETLVEQKTAEIKLFKQEMSNLNEQIEDLVGKLQQQLKVSLNLQKKMVPTELPNIPGFEFSTKFQASLDIGGDYFDIFEIEDRFRFSVLLSSCSGYGISSLFLSILLKMSAQIETKKGAPPDKVVAQIAKELQGQVSEKDTANVFYAMINRRSFEMTYSHYGQNLVFFYDSVNSEIKELKPHGEALGLKFKEKVKSETISLNPKDCLIIISDGIKRVKNSRGLNLETSRIKKIIEDTVTKSPHELRNEIFYQVQKFQNKKELSKDLTVLVAEVKDRVLKLAK